MTMGCTEECFFSGHGDYAWFSHELTHSVTSVSFFFFSRNTSAMQVLSALIVLFGKGCWWTQEVRRRSVEKLPVDLSSCRPVLPAHGAPWEPVCCCSLQTRSDPPSPSLSLCLSPIHNQKWWAPTGSLFLSSPSLPGTLDSFNLYGASLSKYFLSDTSYNSILFTLGPVHALVQAIIHMLIQSYCL